MAGEGSASSLATRRPPSSAELFLLLSFLFFSLAEHYCVDDPLCNELNRLGSLLFLAFFKFCVQ